MRLLMGVFLILCFSTLVQARLPERLYQEKFCEQMSGVMEHVLSDSTRVDCLTEEFAVEVDFAGKWAESLGQTLHYAQTTGKRAGVLLIVTPKTAGVMKQRLLSIAGYYGIDLTVWEVSE